MNKIATPSFAQRQHRTARRAFTATALLACLVSLVFVPTSQANGSLDVSQDGDLISISASQASMMAVIDQLAETTGIDITHTDGLDVMVTIDIENASLEQVIEKLFSNSMIVRKTINGEDIISEIVVMLDDASGGAQVSANLPSGAPAEGVIVGQEPVVDPTIEPPIDPLQANPTVESQDDAATGEIPLQNEGAEIVEGTGLEQGSN